MRKVIILGSGPAGYTAAIYCSRANLQPLLIQGLNMGGQLMITSHVENFPGYPESIAGPDLMENMRKQAERFGTEMLWGDAEKVKLEPNHVTVTMQDGTVIESLTLIIATGATARKLQLPSETAYWGRGVSACAVCDGPFFKGKELVVIGGGDTAMEEALYLTHFATKVTVVHRRHELRASRIMQERALACKQIEFRWNSIVNEIIGEELPHKHVTGVVLKDINTGKLSTVSCGGVFVAIGHDPSTGFFEGNLDKDPAGYILTKGRSTLTNIPGVFAAGDVADPYYRQATSAAGFGCMAAIDCERYLGN